MRTRVLLGFTLPTTLASRPSVRRTPVKWGDGHRKFLIEDRVQSGYMWTWTEVRPLLSFRPLWIPKGQGPYTDISVI